MAKDYYTAPVVSKASGIRLLAIDDNTGDPKKLESTGFESADNPGALVDGATVAWDFSAKKQADLDTAQTALELDISGVTVYDNADLSINKQSTSDLTITLAGANMVFEIFDSANKCFTAGNAIVLSNATADTLFALNFLVTGFVDGSGNKRIRVSGTFSSFTAS